MGSKGPASRLKVKQGKLSLTYPTLPDLGCLLLELDENGCRGSVMFQYVPPQAAEGWKKILAPRRPLRIKLEVNPFLRAFEADGLVTEVIAGSQQIELEMVFNQLPPELRVRLHHAILAMAMQKIRKETQIVPNSPGGVDGLMNPAPAAAPATPAARAPVLPVLPLEPDSKFGAEPEPEPELVPDDDTDVVPVPETPLPSAVVEVPPLAQVVEAPEPHVVKPEVMRSAVTMPAPAVPPAERSDTSTLLKLKKIGEVLIHMGQLNPAQLEESLARAHASRERLGRYLVRAGLVASDVLVRALALQSGLPVTDLSDAEVPERLAKLFGHNLMIRYSFVPFDEAKSFICIAAATPLKSAVTLELERLSKKKIEVFLAQEEMVLKLLDGVQIKQQKKLRKHIRYDAVMPVRYQFCSRLGTPAEQVAHLGVTINISEGGMLIEGTPSALGTPEDMRRRGMCVSVTLGVDPHEVSAICHLRAIREKERKAAEDPRWLLGVEFVEMSAEHRRYLKELCMKAAGQKAPPGHKPFA